jgi:GGDEF domain-containing protein/CHASE3 domain sensor protein
MVVHRLMIFLSAQGHFRDPLSEGRVTGNALFFQDENAFSALRKPLRYGSQQPNPDSIGRGSMKLTISRKMLLSYLVMALLTVMASAYAVLSLRQLNDLAYGIISQDFLVVETSKKMMAALLAQESAERRFLILKDPSIAEIFHERKQEFAQNLQNLAGHPFEGYADRHTQMASLAQQYAAHFEQKMTLVEENRLPEAMALSEEDGRKMIENLASGVRAMQHQAEKNIDTRMNLIRMQGARAAHITIVLTLASLAAGITLALMITYNISNPLKKLEKATSLIAEGQFDHNLQIDRPDEIGRLASAFRIMTKRLKILEALNLDASPLTGLPGNLAIERAIEERLSGRNAFSLCQIDLDHFKPYADKYGYAWASEIIKEVANILLGERERAGMRDVFVGHIGGDDFVLIADPESTETLGRRLVAVFDDHIRPFYSTEDLQRGFIVGKDRKGKEQTFPLLSVSVAMVTGDGHRFKNALEMAELTAELKEFAKSFPGNNFVTEEELAGNHPAPALKSS